MKSYIHPRLLRAEMQPAYVHDPKAREDAVNRVLLGADMDTLMRHALRRARQCPKAPYEPFGIALHPEAAQVLEKLPEGLSQSALIQWILSQ
ncbi:hypothetical protein [Acidithiobacillus sp.]|uniref:hypothetical protein n=1 Tax=Acidithiobacillus sp. TaxID=1872118 RepID=UPI003CFD1B3B